MAVATKAIPAKPAVMWFRNDLRLMDQRALTAAMAEGGPVIPLFVLDDETPGAWRIGGASRWWLHESLTSLAADLAERGSRLILRRGAAREVVPKFAREVGATTVFCSRAYEPWAGGLETDLKAALEQDGIALKRYAGALLFDPDAVKTQTGGPFRVYTPFWRAVTAKEGPRTPVPAPKTIAAPRDWPKSDALKSWALTPLKPDWAGGLRAAWSPGEAGAHARLKTFLSNALPDYTENRNRPDVVGTSRLSPHLHFGEISPAMCWNAAKVAAARASDREKGLETFLKELVWREFSYHLLWHFPTLPEAPFRPEFAAFPWERNKRALAAWQRGQTGIPIVDAGMRELWATGWMHNRVRMIVASFLVKNLLIPWQEGEAWFWDTLVDADLAANAASWQWVAGSGADAAPYFRIFNPVRQGQTFDAAGGYVRRWVPEIAKLDDAHLHAPWDADLATLRAAGVVLGSTYPRPIADLSETRARALAAFKTLKG